MPVLQVRPRKSHARPVQHGGAAGRADGAIVGVVQDIADVDVAQPGFPADGVGAFEPVKGRRRRVAHVEIRVEPGNVPGRVLAEFPGQKGGQLPELRLVVVGPRDEQGGHLQPPAELADVDEVLQHRAQPRPAHPLVKTGVHGLEVDVGRIDEPGQGVQALAALEAVGHHDVVQPGLPGQGGGVAHELEKNRRLGVGVGNRGRARTLGRLHQVGRRHLFTGNLLALARRLGQGVVLAKGAGQVAAHGAEGKRVAARIKMVQRLFFHRVEIGRRHPVVDQGEKLAPLVDAHAAASASAVFDAAEMRAKTAGHTAVRQFLPQRRWVHGFLLVVCPAGAASA